MQKNVDFLFLCSSLKKKLNEKGFKSARKNVFYNTLVKHKLRKLGNTALQQRLEKKNERKGTRAVRWAPQAICAPRVLRVKNRLVPSPLSHRDYPHFLLLWGPKRIGRETGRLYEPFSSRLKIGEKRLMWTQVEGFSCANITTNVPAFIFYLKKKKESYYAHIKLYPGIRLP